jgi:hypothetical protein
MNWKKEEKKYSRTNRLESNLASKRLKNSAYVVKNGDG